MNDPLEQWLKAISPHSDAANLHGFNCDRFRHPVEYALRENLSTLLKNLTGAWRPDVVEEAVANIMRIRAVQDLDPEEAINFAAPLLAILEQVAGADQRAEIGERLAWIGQFARQQFNLRKMQIQALRGAELLRREQCVRIRREP